MGRKGGSGEAETSCISLEQMACVFGYIPTVQADYAPPAKVTKRLGLLFAHVQRFWRASVYGERIVLQEGRRGDQVGYASGQIYSHQHDAHIHQPHWEPELYSTIQFIGFHLGTAARIHSREHQVSSTFSTFPRSCVQSLFQMATVMQAWFLFTSLNGGAPSPTVKP